MSSDSCDEPEETSSPYHPRSPQPEPAKASWTAAQQRLLAELVALAMGDERHRGKRKYNLPDGESKETFTLLCRELHVLFSSHDLHSVVERTAEAYGSIRRRQQQHGTG